ncbi:Asp-tRNA(Asn)/Glu-tRNA(Gln) amidotransferase GatCAB subunit B, partial [Aerococcus urinae]|nr:Asp-tRNA(Asn)/Glu-tRNA(Gln) amidotransferase GatCAB subunit B [Aerococcus urinae]
KQVSNWLMGEVSAYMNDNEKTLDEIGLTPENLTEMIDLIANGTISSKIGKKVFKHLAENGGSAKEYVEKEGLVQISDPETLLPMINEVIDNNPQSLEDYRAGKKKAMGYLVGQLMKQTKGQANPQVLNKLLKQELDKR